MRVSENQRSSTIYDDSMEYQPEIIEDFLQVKDTLEDFSLDVIRKSIESFFQNEKVTMQYCDEMMLNMILTVRKLISFNFFERYVDHESGMTSSNFGKQMKISKIQKHGQQQIGQGTNRKNFNQQQTIAFQRERKTPFRSLMENLLRLLKSSLMKEEYIYDLNNQDVDENEKDPIIYLKTRLTMIQKETNKRNQSHTIQLEQKGIYSQISTINKVNGNLFGQQTPGNGISRLKDETNGHFRATAQFENLIPSRTSSEKGENAFQVKTFRRHENKILKILYKKIQEAERAKNNLQDDNDETIRRRKTTQINKVYGVVQLRQPDITQQIKINLLRTLIYYQEIREDLYVEKLVEFVYEVAQKSPYFSENEQVITPIITEKLSQYLPSIMKTSVEEDFTQKRGANMNQSQKQNRKESTFPNNSQSFRYFSQFQNQQQKQQQQTFQHTSTIISPIRQRGGLSQTINQQYHQHNPQVSSRRQFPYKNSKQLQNPYNFIQQQQALDDFDSLYNGPILPMLIQLFYSEDDYTLNFLILKLIFKCFKQRALIFKQLKHLQILSNKSEVNSFNSIKEKALQLTFDCEQSEIWLKSPDKISDPKFQYKFIIHRVISNIQAFINFCDPRNNPDKEDLTYLKGNIGEISLARQIILRNLRAYEIVIDLIKESEYIIKEIKEEQRNQCLLVRMIETCFNFLNMFIKNNNIYNKKILANYLDLFLEQQRDCIELGQTSLICELYRNNYKLIYSVKEDIIKQFLWKITDDEKKGGHDPLYLEFFEVILQYRRKPVKQNCEKLLNSILEKYSYDIKNLLFLSELIVPRKQSEEKNVSLPELNNPPPSTIYTYQSPDKYEQIKSPLVKQELEDIKSINESMVDSIQEETPDGFNTAVKRYIEFDEVSDNATNSPLINENDIQQVTEGNQNKNLQLHLNLGLGSNKNNVKRKSHSSNQSLQNNNNKYKQKINTQYIFEMKEIKAARDVPIAYQIKILDLLRNIFECLKEKQQILQILMQKTLSINYILELLNKKDIYSLHCRQRSLHKYILNTMMKQSLMKFASFVWLKQDKTYFEAKDNQYIANFIKIETEKLKNITQTDIDHFKSHKRTCLAYRLSFLNKDYSSLNNNGQLNYNSENKYQSQARKQMNEKLNFSFYSPYQQQIQEREYSFSVFQSSPNKHIQTNPINNPGQSSTSPGQIRKDELRAKMLCDKYFNIEAEFNSSYLSYILGVVIPLISFIQRNKYNTNVPYSQSGSNQNSGSFEKDKEMQVIAEFVATFLHFFQTFVSEQNLSELTLNEINSVKEFGHEIQISLMSKQAYAQIEKSIIDLTNEENRLQNQFDPQFPSKHNENIENVIDIPLQDLLDQRSLQYDDDVEKNWRSICINLLTNEQIKQEFILPEINQLTQAFLNFQNHKEMEYDHSLQKFNFAPIDVLKRKFMLFIKATLDKNYDNSNFLRDEIPQSREIVITLIQLLIDFIKQPSKGNINEEDQTIIQNQFQEQENLTTLISILCNEQTHPSIFFALINLAIELLEGGNQKIQEGFYDYFLKNSESENFFYKIYNYLSEEIQNIRREISLNERIRLANKKIEYCYKHKMPNKTTRILRFLQLLTENHNTNLQNYMYTQSNSRTSYDLLNLIVQLVETLVENINQDNYDKLVQCFDTLTEFIQGPCEENQRALSEGRFLEIATKLLKIKGHEIVKDKVQKQISTKKRIISKFYPSTVQMLNQSKNLVGVKLNSYDKHVISCKIN